MAALCMPVELSAAQAMGLKILENSHTGREIPRGAIRDETGEFHNVIGRGCVDLAVSSCGQ